MKGIIDRFEGEFGVVEFENGDIKDIDIKKIPKGAKEGDVLNIHGDMITIDYEETEKVKSEIEKLTEELWEE